MAKGIKRIKKKRGGKERNAIIFVHFPTFIGKITGFYHEGSFIKTGGKGRKEGEERNGISFKAFKLSRAVSLVLALFRFRA